MCCSKKKRKYLIRENKHERASVEQRHSYIPMEFSIPFDACAQCFVMNFMLDSNLQHWTRKLCFSSKAQRIQQFQHIPAHAENFNVKLQ